MSDLTYNGIYPSDLLRATPVFAVNMADLFWGTHFSKHPAFVTWALTERCRLRCQHCSMGTAGNEADHLQRLEIANKLAKTGSWGVSLIGGEPSLIPKLAEYASILKTSGKYLSIGSSGVGLMPHIDQLLECKTDTIVLSVDSHLAEKHDHFRNRSGTFDEVCEVANYILNKRRSKKPHLQIRCTISKQNYRQLEQFVDYWQDKADGITFQIIQDNPIHQVRNKEVLFDKADIQELEKRIEDLGKYGRQYLGDYFKLLSRYVADPKKLKREISYRCLLAPASSLLIMPDGQCRFCYGKADSVVGNILQSELSEIWCSKIARATRIKLQSSDYGCICWENAFALNLKLLKLQNPLQKLLRR